MNTSIIPEDSKLYTQLYKLASTQKVVIFSGLPGVGKSLYVNCFLSIGQKLGKKVSTIQWDMVRKAFETPEILEKYPHGAGIMHNGLRVSAGFWVVDALNNWLLSHTNEDDVLIIEAPLVGNRFIELVKPTNNIYLENFLKSDKCAVVVPIPSLEVREKIETARAKDLNENAKNWIGAKPSVMLKIWKMLCGIANNLGMEINMEGQPPYNPDVYEFVFNKILLHRNFVPLNISEIFKVDITSEEELHAIKGIVPDNNTANKFGKQTMAEYPTDEDLQSLVDNWYLV